MKAIALTGALVRLMSNTGTGALKLGPEERESIYFANQLRELTLTGQLNATWTHIPNELAGQSSKAGASKSLGGNVAADIARQNGQAAKRKSRLAQIRYTIAKAMGMIPGAADYIFLAKHGAFCIEMKSKTGKQTENQHDFQVWCESAGVPYAIVRSADDAMCLLERWGLVSQTDTKRNSSFGTR